MIPRKRLETFFEKPAETTFSYIPPKDYAYSKSSRGVDPQRVYDLRAKMRRVNHSPRDMNASYRSAS